MTSPVRPDRLRFGEFEFDPDAGELRRNGTRVPLPEQPFRLLTVLLERPGTTVTRAELRERLWGIDTFVDFEHGLNAAVKRLRDALGDSAEQPRYIETVPKRGYKFIATTEPEAVPAVSARRWSAGGAATASRPRALLVAGVTAALLIAVAAAARWRTTPAATPATESALRRVTLDAGFQTQPAWSPDGRYLAYAADGAGNLDIWVQPASGGQAIRITEDASDDSAPSWSPDGQWLAYRSERAGGGIYVARLFGGDERRICGLGNRPRWSPDGTRLLVTSGTGQQAEWTAKHAYVVGLDGSAPVEILPAFFREIVQSPSVVWHPDGKRVSVWGYHRALGTGMWTAGLPDGAPVRSGGSQGAIDALVGRFWFVDMVWAPRGDAIYFTAPTFADREQVWRVRVDRGTLEWRGAPEPLTDGAVPAVSVAPSPDGMTLAVGVEDRVRRLWAFRIGRGGRLADAGTPVTPPGAVPLVFDLAADAKQLLLVAGTMRGNDPPEVRARELATGQERVITPRAGPWHALPQFPRWSRDGRQVAFVRSDPIATRENAPLIHRLVVVDAASGAERLVAHVDGERVYTSWDFLPDGRSLVVDARRPDEQLAVLAVQPLEPGAPARRLRTVASRHALHAQVSPDGRWVAFAAATESLDASLYLAPIAGGEPIPLTNGPQDLYPNWSADGRLVYFLSTRERVDGRLGVWAVRVDSDRGATKGSPFPVFTATTATRRLPTAANFGGLRLGGDCFVIPLTERSGSIWTLALR